MEYTKGEWKVDELEAMVFVEEVVGGEEERFYIADCGNTARSVEEDLANAYLIAQAPRLYEALDSLTMAIEADNQKEIAIVLKHLAKPAIAKAEGGQ